MGEHVFEAVIPVALDLSGLSPIMRSEVASAAQDVFGGEYDAPYAGRDLAILDLGANVGAFALWAQLRWPGSTITSYEPDPETFALLKRNTRDHPKIHRVHAAVYPMDAASTGLVRRGGGDIEAALAPVATEFLSGADAAESIEVPVVHPRDLPPADIIKLDVEGCELAILVALDLTAVSLIMLEYHDLERRREIERVTAETFVVERSTAYPWAPYLGDDRYRERAQTDEYGVLVLVNRHPRRLRKVEGSRYARAVAAPGLRQALTSLPGLAETAVGRRVAQLRRRAAR
ncbi:FkbM family methyltransferase [Solirubrobacter sp. CPCC 204708]|uniref:FkbM family methyltransferase n=1 Tax=Solirubrobacter deserti TaxID=2282478 RepID=A0ABT4RR39_9ACTN|nr:FkbM family methyltransferase [Solirubrobacter deserti]MBE2319365.1 FkbM family methyltransferase [Solirubrobacter deserti]MDA0140863.1 FkbM family methyltransferase [Solirubrobacter deserti]